MADTPIIVTLAIGVLGWTLTHIVDRIEGSPALKYSTEHQVSGANSTISLTIKNITDDKTFRKLTIVLAAPPQSTFKDARILPIEPAFEGDEPWQLAGRAAKFTIPAIQPGWEFKITGQYSGSGQAVVRFETADSTIRALEPSIETCLAESESKILYVLVIVWF